MEETELEIDPGQIDGKPRVVGRVGDQLVEQVRLIGGLHVISLRRGERERRLRVLGVGSHPAIAHHVARRRRPDVVWVGLEKSNQLPVESFRHLLPTYEVLTDLWDQDQQSRR